MANSDSGNYYIELKKNTIRFEPVSKANEVFFDEANKQVFAVRAGGAMGVVVKGPDEKSVISFRMDDRGPVTSMRFSPDKRILGVQRSNKCVEFVNFKPDMTTDQQEYSQSCKGKSTSILGFIWTTNQEVVFITDHGLEHYQILPEKRSLKNLKTISIQVNWFVWLAGSNVLLLSTGTLGNQLHPFQFKPGIITRLPKFEVDLPINPKPPKLSLFERDVCLAVIYEQLYIVVLRHQPNPPLGAEVVLYQQLKESPARKTHVLQLDMSGRFAINFVDNLVMVHHQASRTSVTFDIKLGGTTDGFVKRHRPVLPPLPIKPFTLIMPTLNLPAGTDKTEVQCELYSANWIVFQPDIVIDAKLGCLWYIGLNLQPLVSMVPDTTQLIQLLLNRAESKMVILAVCRQILLPGQQVSLQTLASIYDMLNQVYRAYCTSGGDAQGASGDAMLMPTSELRCRVIDQSDMYTHVFQVFEDRKDLKYKFQVSVLIEYIRSLNHFNIPVQHYLYEMIINTLVQNLCYYQLHQFIQYHVLSDSKPLACLMLSMESMYPPAHQLALDMLKRLQTANEEIIEVLLSKQQLLPALRFIRSVGIVDTVSARKFLEAALNADDSKLFYTVFKFFEQRNTKLRGNPRFQPGEHCEQYVQHFESLFGTEALAAVPVAS